MRGLGTLEGSAPVEVHMGGGGCRPAADAFEISQLITEALTAIMRDHRPCVRWAHIHIGADGTPDPGDVAAGIAQGQILVRVQLPGEGPRS
jgi:hypothetical protein